ncbi:hypothetical protein [Anaeromyxobacter dehalogenans]|nr:hypothetical protein [Anaeromyxobacter dehalogenans]
MGPAVQGQGGDHHTFRAAAALVVDFALPEADALDLMREWNATCQPPWPERDLVKKLRSAARSGKHGRGSLLEAPSQRPTFDTADEALDRLIAAVQDRAPADVIGWLTWELVTTARWLTVAKKGSPRPALIPKKDRAAAILLAVGAYLDLDDPPQGPERLAWIMEQAAREHFACVPSATAKREEMLYETEAIDAMQAWKRGRGGVRHAPRILPFAPGRPLDPETLVAHEQEAACFRASLSPLEREVFDGYGEDDALLAERAETTAKTVKSTRFRIRKKASAWGAGEQNEGRAA